MIDTKEVREKLAKSWWTGWAESMVETLCDELDALRKPVEGLPERPDNAIAQASNASAPEWLKLLARYILAVEDENRRLRERLTAANDPTTGADHWEPKP